MLFTQQRDLTGFQKLAFIPDPFPNPCHPFLDQSGRSIDDLHVVFFLHLMARVHDIMREITIVGHKEQPFRFPIQATDREQTRISVLRVKLVDQMFGKWIGQRTGIPRWLVQDQVTAGQRSNNTPLPFDFILLRVNEHTRVFGGHAVHKNFTAPDQLFTAPA